MNVFTVLKLLGSSYLSNLILHGLTHNMSDAGRKTFAANLTVAATDVTSGNLQGAADALTSVILAIH